MNQFTPNVILDAQNACTQTIQETNRMNIILAHMRKHQYIQQDSTQRC